MGFHYFKYIIICTVDKLLVLLKSLFEGVRKKRGITKINKLNMQFLFSLHVGALY